METSNEPIDNNHKTGDTSNVNSRESDKNWLVILCEQCKMVRSVAEVKDVYMLDVYAFLLAIAGVFTVLRDNPELLIKFLEGLAACKENKQE